MYTPYHDDSGNREFSAVVNERGNIDVISKAKNVRRKGKFMSDVFLFSLNLKETKDLIVCLSAQLRRIEKK